MRTKKNEKGQRCDSCQDILKSTMLKKSKAIIKGRGDKYHRADTISLSPTVTDSDVTFIENFSRVCLTDRNKTGQLLRSRLLGSLDYYNEVKRITNQKQETSSLSFPGTDSFIEKFITMYKDKSNDTFKTSLVVCLLKAFVAKMSGELNPVYSPNVFNFYLALSATSRKSFEFVSGNLLGLAIRQIQRRRENMGRNPFISYDLPIVEKKMRALLVRLSDSLGGGRLAFSLAIDGTKVPQTKQISQKYKTIIGGSHPNHFITLDGLSEDEDIKKDYSIHQIPFSWLQRSW